MKPKLLICPGTAYSATTPLYYTLAVNHQYCHGGYDKEYKQLYMNYLTEGTPEHKNYYKRSFRRMYSDIVKDGHYNEEEYGERLRHPKVYFTNEYVNFTDEEKDYYFSLPATIEKYISYYTKHYNNIKGTYQSVCDFSTDYANFPLCYLDRIVPTLKEHFDIKVIMIFRDPVRRFFSQVQHSYYIKSKDSYLHQTYKSARNYFFHLLNERPGKFYGFVCPHDTANMKTAYRDMISHWSKHFPLYYFAMEDLHTSQETLKELSDFLDYNITNVYDNVYWPPMGSKAPKIQYLADQWMSDHEDLSEDDLKEARRLMDDAYTTYPGKISPHWL